MAKGTASSSPSAPNMPHMPPADGRCAWNKLPPELKDIIYEMAYIPCKPIAPLPKAVWDTREAERRQSEGHQFWPGQFTTIARARFTVNHEWCSAALKIFYKYAEFYLKDDKVMNAFLFANERKGILQPYAERIVSIVVPVGIDPDSDYSERLEVTPDVTLGPLVDAVNACPDLTRLKVRYAQNCFWSDLESAEYEFDDVNEDHWNELYPVQMLSRLYGMTCLKIVPIQEKKPDCRSFCSPPHLCYLCSDDLKRIYVEVDNEDIIQTYKRMEDILRPLVARPPPDTDTEDQAGPPDEISSELV